MTGGVNFTTGNNFAEGYALLSPTIQEIGNEFDKMVGLDEEMELYGFTKEVPLTPEGKITAMVGPQPLLEIGEDEETPLLTLRQGYTKGYKLKTFGRKIKVTKLFLKWIENGMQIQGADSSVKAELNQLKDGIRYLIASDKLTKNIRMAKVFANGFSVTQPYGPGSAGGDGKALFATDHPILETGGTFDNTIDNGLDTASVTNTRTYIKAAIAKYKAQMKSQNGYSIPTPNMFTILVPRQKETIVREALNTPGSQAGQFSGDGTNANQLNVFNFEGSRVEIVVLPMLGEIDENGDIIGGANANNMWFLLNKELAKQVRAFRMFTLWDKEMGMYKNEETESVFVRINSHFECDFYNPEVALGYSGA